MSVRGRGFGGMSLLSTGDIELILGAAKKILSQTGCKFLDPDSVEILRGLGAKVEDSGRTFIWPEMVDQALSMAPKSIAVYDRVGKMAMELGGEEIYFGSLTNGFKYLDPMTDRAVTLNKEHERAMVRLTDALANIDYAMNSGTLGDCEHGYPGAEALAIVAENTTKPIGFTTNDFESCREAVALAEALVGGAEKLGERPFIIHYAEPISPLVHSLEACLKLKFFAQKAIPITYTPYVMMGGTGPMSFAAVLAQVFAEMLAGLVLHQAVRPGAPFIMGGMPAYLEMRHSIGVMGAPELHLLIAASAEVAKSLKLPFFGTAGCSDSPVLDLQAAAEVTMSLMSALLSPAHLIHDLGLMGHGESTSPATLVLCDELIGLLAPFRKGLVVNEKTLALEVIDQVGPGGHFLTHQHTLANFRLLTFSKLLDRTRTFLGTTLDERIRAKTTELLRTHKPEPLTQEQAVIMADFRAKWRETKEK
ncbi:MAG: trimethylamine methyltransferase family protein [Deltaproteobacteria bacterium]|jgi:trimethylamine--corrinoid protein Co-methyltransferase|nr:trimethylamine methyltransferase family protein [Deltaproteobacteria bacterium]